MLTSYTPDHAHTHTFEVLSPGQTRHTSGHFNMNVGVKGDDGERGETGNTVSRSAPSYRGLIHTTVFEVSAVCEMSCY